MVLLDQHHVEQADAEVLCATAADGVFLRGAQSRQRLASVENGAACAGHCVDERARLCRRAGQHLQKVERRALARQDGARGSLELEYDLIRADAIAIARVPVDPNGRVEPAEGLIDPRLSAQDSVLARNHTAMSNLCVRHETRGDVAGADVLAQRSRDLVAKILRNFDHGHRLQRCTVAGKTPISSRPPKVTGA